MNKAHEGVQQISDCMRDATPNVFTYWLRHGHEGLVAELNKSDREYVQSLMPHAGPMRTRQCYANAQRLIMEDMVEKRLTYHEGWFAGGTLGTLPMHHAWVCISGIVVDPTAALILKKDDPPFEYFGVEVSRKLLLRFHREYGYYAGVTDVRPWMFEALQIDVEDGCGKRKQKAR